MTEAKAAFDPGEVADNEEQARASWGVRINHGPVDGPGAWAGTSWLEATGDTLDLTSFHDLVRETAEQLRRDGDESPLGMRQARAIGIIADRARGIDGSAATTGGGSSARTRLIFHVTSSDLDDPGAVGGAERLGTATLARIREWLAGSRATILPVLDMSRVDDVDAHDPPAWMRELVILRDRSCVFPWCERDARSCDLDHIDPYVENGPPGQTRPGNLAPLCRRHHRGKTERLWRYRRNPDGSYTWRFPLGRGYLVTGSGTTRLC